VNGTICQLPPTFFRSPRKWSGINVACISTSLIRYAATKRSPLRPDQIAALSPATTVYDLIYTPRPTALLRLARQQGCRTIDGLEMLVQQGAASLRLWSGLEEMPVIAMRAAALARLEGP
jgi:shikimate dehydrogenase